MGRLSELDPIERKLVDPPTNNTPSEDDDDSPTLEGAVLLLAFVCFGLWIVLGVVTWWVLINK